MVLAFHSAVYVLPESPADTSWGDTNPALWFLSRGAFGVTIFFVISGYCIFAALDGTMRRGATVIDFMKRRVTRIYPPFWASLVLVFVVSAALAAGGLSDLITQHEQGFVSPPILSRVEWFTNLTLTHTWLPFVLGTYARGLNGVSWSLCYEEQFYFVCALSLAFMPKRTYVIPLVVTAAVLVLAAVDLFRTAAIHEAVRGTFIGPKWLQFALGGLLYYRLVRADGLWIPILDGVVFAIPVSLAFLMVSTDELRNLQWSNQVFQLLVAASCTACLRLVRPHEPKLLAWLARVRAYRPLRRFGEMTYSVYLVHAIVVSVITGMLRNVGMTSTLDVLLVALPTCFVAATIVSAIFFRLVESRFLNAPSPAAIAAPRYSLES